jgi:hypothetical protein
MPIVIDEFEVVTEPPPAPEVTAPQGAKELDARAAAAVLRQLAVAEERAERLRAD